jgi:hypothetical protein
LEHRSDLCQTLSEVIAAKQSIREALGSAKLSKILRIVDGEAIMSENFKGDIHRLVHLHSESPYTKSVARLGTPYIVTKVLNKLKESDRKFLKSMVSAYSRDDMTGQVAGKFFEQIALSRLAQGGEFVYRSHDRTLNSIIKLRKSELTTVKEVTADQLEYVLYVPNNTKYPGIDAWMHGVGGFQVTLNAKHGLNARIRSDLPLLKGGAHKLFWVVRPQEYESFEPPMPSKVKNAFSYPVLKQYVLKIPDGIDEMYQIPRSASELSSVGSVSDVDE